MATACIAGSTGLVGGHILTELLASQHIDKVYAYTRKDLTTNPKLTPLQSADNTTWTSLYPSNASIFFSGLGTTRAQAGGFQNQVKIDLDLNLALAKAAKDAGTKIYVLISSGGSSSSSPFGYPKMKGQLEDEVSKLGFDHCIILRPGLIVGSRDHLRSAEAAFQGLARVMGSIHHSAKDFWAQDAETIGRAAVKAGQDALEVKMTDKVKIINQPEIIRLGKTEWK